MFGFLASPCRTCATAGTRSVYRRFFCGLSGALRDDYSPAARLLVNRDATFLSLATASLAPAAPEATMRTCCQPMAAPRPLFSNGVHARYAAAVTLCGLTAKLDDDRLDERGLRRVAAGVLGRALAPLTDKAISLLNSLQFPTSQVQDILREQNVVEARRPDLRGAAEPTARSYGIIFGHGAVIAGSPEKQSHLAAFGQSLGRLIYWKDAHDDLAEDRRRGRFNPLVGTSQDEWRESFGSELDQLRESPALHGPFEKPMKEVIAATRARHRNLLPADRATQENQTAEALPQKGRKGRKGKKGKDRKKSRDRCWDCLCPCHEGSPMDGLVDCGPGDTGCCDCDCCP